MLRLKRGGLSDPVIVVIVIATLLLLAIGAAVIAYFTLFTGGAPQPGGVSQPGGAPQPGGVSQSVLSISGQPVAYVSVSRTFEGYPKISRMRVVVTVANVGSVPVELAPSKTTLAIVSPITEFQQLDSLFPITVAPGSTATLTFEFFWGYWDYFEQARGVLHLVDTAGRTVGVLEVTIKVVGGG